MDLWLIAQLDPDPSTRSRRELRSLVAFEVSRVRLRAFARSSELAGMVVASGIGSKAGPMQRITVMLALGLGACHSGMMSDIEAMRGYIDDTRRETDRHLDVARAARTMQDVHREMARHETGMTPMMSDIDTMMDGMTSHCDGTGLRDMRAIHGELDGEVALHAAVMDTTTDLAAAMVEVQRHTSTMMETMAGMDGAMDRMHCR